MKVELGQDPATSNLKDAIHVAVASVTAYRHGDPLKPGQHVTVDDGTAHAASDFNGVGIVDPFLTEPVKPGELFWVVLKPGTAKNLSHTWEHPSFPKQDDTDYDDGCRGC